MKQPLMGSSIVAHSGFYFWLKNSHGSDHDQLSRVAWILKFRRLGNCFVNVVEIALRDAIRRHHVNRVAERTQQQIPACEKLQKLWPDPREIATVAHVEIESRNTTGSTDIPESLVGPEW